MMLHTFSSLFESSSLTPEQKSFLDFSVKGSWTIHKGKIDVAGDVNMSNFFVPKIPVAFGKISGHFFCDNGKLISLENAPEEIGGNFLCHENLLTTLVKSPSVVGGTFSCASNRLVSLEGAPKHVGESFLCDRNLLTSLKNSPLRVKGSFHCTLNQLTSLENAPFRVDGNFDCKQNPLETFNGAPKYIGGMFSYDDLKIGGANWNLDGWIKFYRNSTEPKTKSLLAKLIVLEIKEKMKTQPEKALMKLKGIWNSPDFAHHRKGIEIPSRYEEEMDTLVDLDDLGF